MSAALIWIFFPFVTAAGLWLINKRESLTARIAAGVSLLLAWLAWQLPVGARIDFGLFRTSINETFAVFGRQLTITQADTPVLILVYLIAAGWFFAIPFAGAGPQLAPLGLGITALLVAALAVQPFLYAALILEIAVLLSIPMLSPPGKPVGRGALRYLIMQTLAMPFILFTGWMLTGVEAGQAAVSQAKQAGVLLGLGFAFLLAVFPFYAWIPLISEESHPYVAGFILVMMPMAGLFLGLDFLDNFAWLRETVTLYTSLQITGVVMVLTGGIWAAFQNHLGRVMGYAAIMETGLALLAVSLGAGLGAQVFALLLLPRAIGLGCLALTLAVIHNETGTLHLDNLRGLAYRLPLAASALLLSLLSLSGLPLLAGFPARFALLEGLAQQSLPTALWVVLGTLGLLMAGLRAMASAIWREEPVAAQVGESAGQIVVLGIGALALLVVGIWPQLTSPSMLDLLSAYVHLAP